jgi:hypothetical protein
MESRFKEHADKEAKTSFFRKFGRLLTTIFVFSAVGLLVAPHIYEIYENTMDAVKEPTDAAPKKTVDPETKAERARMRAEKRDRQEQEKIRAQEEHFEEMYKDIRFGDDEDDDEYARDPRDDL